MPLPIAQIGLDALPGRTVDLPEPADQQLALAGDAFEVLIGEPAPSGPEVTLDLLPVVFHAFPIHRDLLFQCRGALWIASGVPGAEETRWAELSSLGGVLAQPVV